MNPKISKGTFQIIGPLREELIVKKDKEIEEKQMSIRENQEIAEDENEDRATRGQAREEETQQIDALWNKRERNSLRERVRNIFKKYGFIVSLVVLAVRTMIGVIVSSMK